MNSPLRKASLMLFSLLFVSLLASSCSSQDSAEASNSTAATSSTSSVVTFGPTAQTVNVEMPSVAKTLYKVGKDGTVTYGANQLVGSATVLGQPATVEILGSVNYINGFPHWGVSIALVRGRDPILGIVALPQLDEVFAGIVGRGATLNGAPMTVSAVTDPNAGVLATGIPARARVDEAGFADFMRVMLAWRKVRMIGSAAAALAYVAAGRADAYRETGSMLWDVAAGCALVRAAGGRVEIIGDRLDAPLSVRADNGRVAA